MLDDGRALSRTVAFELKAAPGLESVEVPRLLLQPCGKRAKHGSCGGPGQFVGGCIRQGQMLTTTISDDGVGIDDRRSGRTGSPMCAATGVAGSPDDTFAFAARELREPGEIELSGRELTHSVVIVDG